MTIQRAREILSKKAEKLTDEEISKLLQILTIIVNKAIESAIQDKV